MGKGKRFPSGPTCEVHGKNIPCLCTWSPEGSMTSDIPTSIVETRDVLEVFDRSTGKSLFMLLDGHGSRLGLSFLNYINDPLHPWAA